MGTAFDGAYFYSPQNCGVAGVSPGAAIIPPTCNGLSDGTITPIVNAGNGPYTYLWNNGSTDSTITGLAAGNYSVRIVNAQGCYEDVSYTVHDPYEITFGAIAPPTCPGGLNGMATLNSTGCQCMFSTCTFIWENGVTVKPNFDLPEGWSWVVITHPDGCVVTDSVFVPFSEPILDTILVSAVNCFGDSTGIINLIPDNNFTPLTVNWSDGQQDAYLDSLAAGTYSVQLMDSRGCIDSLQIQVPENSPINYSGTSLNVLCFGDSSGSISLSIQGGVAPYSVWMNNQPQDTTITGLSIGNYSITISDSLGCLSADTLQFTITQPTAISANYNVTFETLPNTNSGSIVASVQGGTPPYSYLWNDPNNQTDSIASNLNTGWYELQVSDSNGCVFTDSVFVGLLGIENNLAEQGIGFYPNPVKNQIRFSTSVARIKIYSSLGELVAEAYQVTEMDMSKFVEGIYFMELTRNGHAYRYPIVKVD